MFTFKAVLPVLVKTLGLKNPSLLRENPQTTVDILVVIYVNDLADDLTIDHLLYSNNVKNAPPYQSSLGANSK